MVAQQQQELYEHEMKMHAHQNHQQQVAQGVAVAEQVHHGGNGLDVGWCVDDMTKGKHGKQQQDSEMSGGAME